MDELVEAEFGAARDEINMRTQLGVTILGFDLAALGTGLSLVSKSPSVGLALAAVSAFLWSLWLDQASQVWKLAAYVALRLGPRAGPGKLEWEPFLRVLDEGGRMAAVLVPPKEGVEPPDIPRWRTRNIAFYISMLLGGTPVILVVVFFISGHLGDTPAGTWLELALVIAVWLNSLRLYQSFRELAGALDGVIRQQFNRPAGPPASDA
jgi:hypothetical protein